MVSANQRLETEQYFSKHAWNTLYRPEPINVGVTPADFTRNHALLIGTAILVSGRNKLAVVPRTSSVIKRSTKNMAYTEWYLTRVVSVSLGDVRRARTQYPARAHPTATRHTARRPLAHVPSAYKV
ncbi:jg22982 [Pararge aegeria aegeria]|uniref:Jg22982 protein n=1 Tax=Pararge aegeria aegeria TaxID=348720 RepID=A0A8S4QXM6_9NEOP|nr:jg22982 [Pararge aegeria aegeria]